MAACPLPSGHSLWGLCRENSQGSSAVEQGWGKTCSIVLRQWPGDVVLTGMHSLRMSQSSEAVLSEEYNWGSKSPWSQLQILDLYGKAELQVLNSGSLLELWLSPEHRDLPLGKAFFSYY